MKESKDSCCAIGVSLGGLVVWSWRLLDTRSRILVKVTGDGREFFVLSQVNSLTADESF